MTSHWRQHWADRENARRQVEHDKAALAWQQDLEQIRRYHRLSITAGPAINTSGIKLHHGENLWWTTTGATLIEMPGTVDLAAADHGSFCPTSAATTMLPRGVLRDSGFVAITNQRVMFLGALGQHDWCFSQLTGVAHGTKETVMCVENRRTLCGLAVAPALAAGFRFHLALALAEHRDDREGFTDHLARLLDRKQFYGPGQPSPAVPADAPHPLRWVLRIGRRLYFGRPGASAARQVMPALATAVLLACGFGLGAMPNLDRRTGGAEGGRPSPSQGTSALGDGEATPVGMPVGPLGPPDSQQQDTPQKGTPQKDSTPQRGSSAIEAPTPKPSEPPPSSGPPPVNLCGAPANPWNFNFCASAGGSLIADPPAAFCSYFLCADDFWRNTNGFVVECQDGVFSQTGGRPGTCQQHGGIKRALRR